MLKILYTAINGYLTADISSVSPLLPVDYDTYSDIAANVNFGAGEWTYLRLDNGVYSEEVKVTGLSTPNLIIERGKSGSTPQAFSADETSVTNVFGADAVTDVVAQSTPSLPFTLNSTGIAEVTHVDSDYNVHVASPNFIGEGGVEIMGQWPNITFGLSPDASGCCGDGGPVGEGGGITELNITSTILQGSIAGNVLNLALQAPNFQGVGITISGTWPDITFTASGGSGGTGTVTEVAVGGGLTLTGNPNINPNIALTPTGITPGTYGGLGINVYGQIDNIPAGFDPISTITFSGGTGTVSRVGSEASIVLQDADIGQKGVVEFADHNSPLNLADDTKAATPAYVAAAMGNNINDAAGSATGEADAAYTNILSGTAINVTLAAGEKALVQGVAVVLNDTTPDTPYNYGLAVFDAGGVKRIANKKCNQSNQTIMGVLTGPLGPTTISLVTTDIAAGNTLQSSFLSLIKL